MDLVYTRVFAGATALQYNWTPSRSPTNCACRTSFSVKHALSNQKKGFPSLCQNEICDLTASLLTEVCNDVSVKPDLQIITGEVFSGWSAHTSDGARLDMTANGFWGGRLERMFVYVCVFNPTAPSKRQISLEKCFKGRSHEARCNLVSMRIQSECASDAHRSRSHGTTSKQIRSELWRAWVS